MNATLMLTLLGFGITFLGSWLMISYSKSFGLVAHVNQRSSHYTATPVGGGIPIVIVVSVLCLVIELLYDFTERFAIVYIVCGLVIATVALYDDLVDLSSWKRLSIYIAVSCLAVYLIGPVTSFTFPGYAIQLGWVAFPLTVLFVVWMINLFNFMDGIDGIVASQAVIVGFGLWFLTSSTGFGLICATLGAAYLGFLCWNFPIARLFMGDVGSTFLGFSVALVLVENSSNTDWVASGLILLIPLTVDATMTLLMRLFSGENIFKAHKKHLYQQLAMRFKSHQKVTLGYLAFQTCVLFPLAIFCSLPGASSAWILHSSYFGTCLIWASVYYLVLIRPKRPRQSEI